MNQESNSEKVAIVFRGGFSTTGRSPSGREKIFDVKIKDTNFKDMRPCCRSVLKNIVQYNSQIDFDFFIHCWTPQLQHKFEKYYRFKKSHFEYQYHNPENLNGQFWQALSFKKSLRLLDDQPEYKFILLIRPDVVISKPFDITELIQSEGIYAPFTTDDLLFGLHPKHRKLFMTIYKGLIEKTLPASPHRHIKIHMGQHKMKIGSLNGFKRIAPFRPHKEIILINRYNEERYSIIKIQSVIRKFLLSK